MNYKLSSLAKIHSGVVLSRKEAPTSFPSALFYKRFTLRSFNESGNLIKQELEPFWSKEPIEPTLLSQQGDILVRLCMPINPIFIPREPEGVVIPSQIAVIRVIDKSIVLPAYLRWYLSQKSISDTLQAAEHGTAQRTIKVKSIMDLDIIVPSLNLQKQIAQIDTVSRQREQLYQDLIIQERLETEQVLATLMGGKDYE